MKFMKRLLIRCLGLFLALVSIQVVASENAFPTEIEAALSAPDGIVLYSLEPWERSQAGGEGFFHYIKVLGSVKLNSAEAATAVAAFRDAVSSWKNPGWAAACFDPRHALSIQSKGHVYDLLLCYQCSQLEVMRDGQSLVWLGAAGSPAVLNSLLESEHIPLSKTAH
jgi:hypothetical protein